MGFILRAAVLMGLGVFAYRYFAGATAGSGGLPAITNEFEQRLEAVEAQRAKARARAT